jgi:hypothetical protein
MHDSSVLQRDGRASHYITPVSPAITTGGTLPIGGSNRETPAAKGPHHCFHFLHSLGGGEPCRRGEEQCPYLHLTSFESALEFDYVLNLAAKNNITLDRTKFGKRPFDAMYPDVPTPGAGKQRRHS